MAPPKVRPTRARSSLDVDARRASDDVQATRPPGIGDTNSASTADRSGVVLLQPRHLSPDRGHDVASNPRRFPAERVAWPDLRAPEPSTQTRYLQQHISFVTPNSVEPLILRAYRPILESGSVRDKVTRVPLATLRCSGSLRLHQCAVGRWQGSCLDLQAANLETSLDWFGGKNTQRGILLFIVRHAAEHLGQSIAYARFASIVPPWSEDSRKK